MPSAPNLFLAGATKSGTTSLYRYLAQHPDIFAPQIKEPHWAAADLDLARHHGVADRDDYLALYGPGANSSYRMDGSTSSLLSPSAADRIRELSPDAIIIIMLRDPVEVVPALHGQVALGGLQTDEDLKRAVARARKLRGRPLTGLGWRVWTRYHDVVDYAPQVRRFLHRFPADQVHILWFDDLRDNTEAVWCDLQRRLGIPWVPADLRPRNPAVVVRRPILQRLVTNPPFKRQLRAFLPGGPARRFRAAVTRRNVHRAPRPAMLDDLRRQLAHDLRPGVDELARLLDHDLDTWARP